jgi:hypothetical protein
MLVERATFGIKFADKLYYVSKVLRIRNVELEDPASTPPNPVTEYFEDSTLSVTH